MTKRLLLTIALGSALAVFAAAYGAAVDVGGAQVQIPGGAPLPACSDLSDNDGDGMTDLADPGCGSPLDSSEYNAPAGRAPGHHPELPGVGTPGGGPPAAAPAVPGQRRQRRWWRRQARSGRQEGKTGSPKGGLFGKKAPKGAGVQGKAQREKMEQVPIRNPDGSPSNANPGLTIADFGAAPIGVPNFVIDQFEIPPFLLPIYQACGTEYGIPWQVLASINRIETAFGTNLNVSSAGALGWMQFIPSSWQAYGVDANEDGRKDPYNPVDAHLRRRPAT